MNGLDGSNGNSHGNPNSSKFDTVMEINSFAQRMVSCIVNHNTSHNNNNNNNDDHDSNNDNDNNGNNNGHNTLTAGISICLFVFKTNLFN